MLLSRPDVARSGGGRAARQTSRAAARASRPRRSSSATRRAASRCATRTSTTARSRRSSSTRWSRRAPRSRRTWASTWPRPRASSSCAISSRSRAMTGPPVQVRADDGHGRRRQVGTGHAPSPAREPARLRLARHHRPRAHPPRGHARVTSTARRSGCRRAWRSARRSAGATRGRSTIARARRPSSCAAWS